MEEMLEVMKKQLKMQKLISGLLAVMLVILLIAGGFFVNRMLLKNTLECSKIYRTPSFSETT